MNRRLSVVAGSVLLCALCALTGCGGGAEPQDNDKAKVSAKTFDADPCDALEPQALIDVIKPVSAQVDLPPLKSVTTLTRFADEFSHCRYMLKPSERELDGTKDSIVTVYNEQAHGDKLMAACRERAGSGTRASSGPAASAAPGASASSTASTSSPASANSGARASGAPGASPSTRPGAAASPSTGTRTSPAPAASTATTPPAPAGGPGGVIGDETCLDALGQVRVRLGDRYFSVVANLATGTPADPTPGSLSGATTPELTQVQKDARNVVVARAVAAALAERLRP